MLVVATQARGSLLIHQKMFESRLFFVDKIIENLSSAVRILNLVKVQEIEQTAAIEDLAMRFTELRNLRFSELDGDPASREKYDAIMQEANLVIEQLIWLNGLSEQIVATAQKLKKFT